MWRPVDEPWQYRLLDALPSSVDEAQLKRALEMTVSQRIDAMCRLVSAAEQLRRPPLVKEG